MKLWFEYFIMTLDNQYYRKLEFRGILYMDVLTGSGSDPLQYEERIRHCFIADHFDLNTRILIATLARIKYQFCTRYENQFVQNPYERRAEYQIYVYYVHLFDWFGIGHWWQIS